MLSLQPEELNTAAAVFADGFADDPAFSLALDGEIKGKTLLYQYFLNYISACKELLLYKYSEAGEGYLCLYRHDTSFSDFAVPQPLMQMEEFQCIDRYYSRDFAVLDIMAVAPQCRGKGIAGQMIDFFVEYCRREGLLAIVEVFSDAHLQLYYAHGFTVAHRRHHRGITTYILEYSNDSDNKGN